MIPMHRNIQGFWRSMKTRTTNAHSQFCLALHPHHRAFLALTLCYQVFGTRIWFGFILYIHDAPIYVCQTDGISEKNCSSF